jgi:hypothetical protein
VRTAGSCLLVSFVGKPLPLSQCPAAPLAFAPVGLDDCRSLACVRQKAAVVPLGFNLRAEHRLEPAHVDVQALELKHSYLTKAPPSGMLNSWLAPAPIMKTVGFLNI